MCVYICSCINEYNVIETHHHTFANFMYELNTTIHLHLHKHVLALVLASVCIKHYTCKYLIQSRLFVCVCECKCPSVYKCLLISLHLIV